MYCVCPSLARERMVLFYSQSVIKSLCTIDQCPVNTVACRVVSSQLLGTHVPAPTDKHAIIDTLLEMVFSTRSVQKGL
jgi:hypothetical protein